MAMVKPLESKFSSQIVSSHILKNKKSFHFLLSLFSNLYSLLMAEKVGTRRNHRNENSLEEEVMEIEREVAPFSCGKVGMIPRWQQE